MSAFSIRIGNVSRHRSSLSFAGSVRCARILPQRQRSTASKGIEARDELNKRSLPEMTLSQGTPTPPNNQHRIPAERSLHRFQVSGNAIVTGGAGGLGSDATRALLEHGCTGVALLDVSFAQSEESISQLRAEFPTAKILTKTVDVSSESQVIGICTDVWKELGPVSNLLCFAGVVGCFHSVETSADQFRRILDINTTGAFLCARAFAKLAIENDQAGSIVFVASIGGKHVLFPQPQAAYNTSKAALLHLTRCLAAEWATHGIRVNSVSPGYMDTILNEGPGLERARNVWKSRIPMGRLGLATELIGPIVFLCSNAGTYITGADITVDGGFSTF